MKRSIFLMADAGGATGGDAGTGSGTGAAGGGAATVQPITGTGGAGFTWAKEDGTFSDGWLDKLPAEMRGHASLRSIGTLPDLAKSYIATKEMVGKRLEAPGADATPEQLASWRRIVGVPDRPEGYLADGAKSLRPDSIPENLWDAAGERKFVELAHRHNIPPAAVKDILGFYGDSVAESLVASEAQESAMLGEQGNLLRSAWGSEYEAKLSMAARVAHTVGLDPKTHPVFTDATVVQAFAKMGQLLAEDKLVRGDTQGVNGSLRDKIHDLTDPKSTSILAREYRGEFGSERQGYAQAQYHQLLKAAGQTH